MFPPDVLAKHFVGLVCAAILAEEGFEATGSSARLRKDDLFGSGSRFRRVRQPDETQADDLLERMLKGLTKAEKHRALKFLEQELERDED